MKKILLLLILLILITGCSIKKEEKVKKREIKKSYLKCTSNTIDNGVRSNIKVNIQYYDNTILYGKIRYEIILPTNSSEEEKEILNTISMCSTEAMTNLIKYGTCLSKVDDNKLISTLIIDKEKIKNYNKSITDIKEEIENNNILNCKCSIK